MPHCGGLCFIHVSLRVVLTGSSSARIVVTLVHALRQRGLKRGIASACIGGGEAMAVAVEVC
jgi:acetyl-CoA acetyltransferase